jgi:hypothetical protein
MEREREKRNMEDEAIQTVDLILFDSQLTQTQESQFRQHSKERPDSVILKKESSMST